MRKLVIPLFIPCLDGNVDYESLKNIILDIRDSIVLIGNYRLNNLEQLEKINIYLYLNLINSDNEYYIDERIDDELIKCNDKYLNEDNICTILGNVFFLEVYEYLLNLELDVNDKSLNKFLKVINDEINKAPKEIIEYILIKKKKIIKREYPMIDNLLGIYEI